MPIINTTAFSLLQENYRKTILNRGHGETGAGVETV
jgi:hypothetical protein